MTVQHLHFTVFCLFSFIFGVMLQDFSSECVPRDQFVPDIPCRSTNSTHVHEDMPFCAEFISYDIDQRLDCQMLDERAQQQLNSFNATFLQASEDCYRYRKALTCALAFPECSSKPYVQFPCKDVCLAFYTACGDGSGYNSCSGFPTSDCVRLYDLVPQASSSILLLPTITLMLLCSIWML